MFGPATRFAQDLPTPHGAAFEPGFFAGVAQRAVRHALGPFPGPVHLNFPFEEPLIGAGAQQVRDAPPARRIGTNGPPPLAHDAAELAHRLRDAQRPLIVAGPELPNDAIEPIAALAATLGAPLLADPLSGLRTGSHDRSQVITSYDAIVRDRRARTTAPPDAIIRFGARPTSKALNELIESSDALQVLCEPWGSWRIGAAVSTRVLPGDPAVSAAILSRELSSLARAGSGWLDEWRARDRAAGAAMREAALEPSALFEGRVFIELQDALPAGVTVVAGNSMPVRDMDSFVVAQSKPIRFLANRGANGIDGVSSTALGVAASGQGPVVLVIGDISFYHDLSGLWAAMRHRLNLTVVLINNNGSGIFHYLPQAAYPEIFEDWFGTPPNLEFEHAVRLFGGRYVPVPNWSTFRDALLDWAPGLRVLELRTDRALNESLHREAWRRAGRAAWDPVEELVDATS